MRIAATSRMHAAARLAAPCTPTARVSTVIAEVLAPRPARGVGARRRSAAARNAATHLTSGRPDLNRGPHRPERCALPGCATPRRRRLSQRGGCGVLMPGLGSGGMLGRDIVKTRCLAYARGKSRSGLFDDDPPAVPD